MLDPFILAGLSRREVLTCTGGPRFTCCICGAPQESGAWRVRLPHRGTHLACPGCAGDHGWEVR